MDIWFVFGFSWGFLGRSWCVEAPLVWTRPCLVWNWQQRSVRSGQDTSQQRIIVISLGLNVLGFLFCFPLLGNLFCFPFSDNDDGSDDDGRDASSLFHLCPGQLCLYLSRSLLLYTEVSHSETLPLPALEQEFWVKNYRVYVAPLKKR